LLGRGHLTSLSGVRAQGLAEVGLMPRPWRVLTGRHDLLPFRENALESRAFLVHGQSGRLHGYVGPPPGCLGLTASITLSLQALERSSPRRHGGPRLDRESV